MGNRCQKGVKFASKRDLAPVFASNGYTTLPARFRPGRKMRLLNSVTIIFEKKGGNAVWLDLN